MESIDQILQKPKTKQRIDKLHQEVVDRITLATGMINPSPEKFTDVGPAVCRAYEDKLREILVDHLGSPPCATGNDLGTAFEHHLLVARGTFDSAYPGFCAAVSRMMRVRRSPPIAIATGPFVLKRHADEQFREMGICLWESAVYQVFLVGALPSAFEVGHHDAHGTALFISVQACSAAHAFQQATAEISEVVRSLVTSATALSTVAEDMRVIESVQRSGECPEGFEWSRFQVADGDSLCGPFRLIREGLASYFSATIKKDTIARRIRNATRLMVEADRQSGNGVGLALSVASVEALLGRKESDLSKLVSENVAALLEPDGQNRVAAVEWVKQLYSLRSEILHGTATECSVQQASEARTLAAAVLKAILERRDFQKRMDNANETVEGLLKELHGGKFVPGRLTGVEDSPVRGYWIHRGK